MRPRIVPQDSLGIFLIKSDLILGSKVGALLEVREIVRDFEVYLEDYWNILDVLCLTRNTDSDPCTL